LERFQDNHSELFEELMDYYQQEVFPSTHTAGAAAALENTGAGNQEEAGMNESEQVFFQQLEN
jgi:hypothetical protein